MVRKKVTDLVESQDPKTKRWKSTFAAARMAYETGEFRQAETLCARAMEMAKDLPDHVFATNATEVGTGAVLLAQKRTREAEGKLSKAITKLDSYGDDAHKELLAVALRFHAQALCDSGDERGAEKDLDKSAAILKDLGPDACVQLAYTYSDLCGLYLTQGRYSEADKFISSAMKIAELLLGTDSALYVRADMIYAVSRPTLEDSRLDTAADALQRLQYAYGAKHPNIARALDRYFKVLDQRGETQKIEEATQRFGARIKSRN